MGTLNDWFTSEGFAKYTVANGKLKSGDEIAVQHTCNLGADIGGSFDASDKSLKAIALSAGELTPAFSSDNHAYTMILPDGTDSLTVTPTASNKQNRVRIYAGNTEYRRMDAIPVQHGTVITLKVGNDGDTAPEVYTITLQAAGTLLNKDSVSLTTIREDGSVGSTVALQRRRLYRDPVRSAGGSHSPAEGQRRQGPGELRGRQGLHGQHGGGRKRCGQFLLLHRRNGPGPHGDL